MHLYPRLFAIGGAFNSQTSTQDYINGLLPLSQRELADSSDTKSDQVEEAPTDDLDVCEGDDWGSAECSQVRGAPEELGYSPGRYDDTGWGMSLESNQTAAPEGNSESDNRYMKAGKKEADRFEIRKHKELPYSC